MKKSFYILLLVFTACGPAVSTRVVDPSSTLSKYRQDITTSSSFSPETSQAIRLANSTEKQALSEGESFVSDPLFQKFSSKIQTAYVGSELALGRALHIEKKEPEKALGYFLKSAQYATDGALSPECAGAFDIRCEGLNAFYARSVIGIFNFLKNKSWQPQITAPDGKSQPTSYNLSFASREGFEQPQDYEFLQPSASIDLEGLPNRYHRWGAGLAMTACRKKKKDSYMDSYLPEAGLCIPITTIITFDDPCSPENCSAHISLNNSLKKESLTTAEKVQVPLQSDFTAPFAKILERSGIGNWDGFFGAFSSNENIAKKTGFFSVEPYDPEKIPVIMVHGLFSSPATWLSLYNDLMGDPLLRKNFQIWSYQYPTNLPILLNAKTFRDNLDQLEKFMQDHGAAGRPNPGMVVIAHSMGGILTKTVTVKSSTDLVNSVVSAEKVKELDPEIQKELQDFLDFKRKPYINRVIFVSVPHRGSIMSDNFIGHVGRWLIHLPSAAIGKTTELLEKSKNALTAKFSSEINGDFSSIKGLSPNNPVLQSLAEIAVDENIPFHSIIGDRGLGGGKESSDGVVAYSSSHLEGAESELVVPSEHNAHTHPAAVQEIKRILHLHLEKKEAENLKVKKPLKKGV